MNLAGSSLARLRHDVRTPLNHIIGYTEMLLEEIGTADQAAAADLHSVHACAHRVLARTEELLGDAQPSSGLSRGGPTSARPEGTKSDGAVEGREGTGLAALGAELAAPLQTIERHLDALAGGPCAGDDLDRIGGAVAALRALLGGANAASRPADPVLVPTRPGEAGAAEATSSAAGGAPTAMAPCAKHDVIEAASVLIVDDDPNNLDMLRRRMSRDGHRTRLASSGVEALAALAEEPFDLVLLDVMMAGMDGDEVLRRMKGDERWCDIPVLMISALDEAATVAACIEIGADDYLPKPFEPVILRARVAASLERKRLRDRAAAHLRELGEWNVQLESRVAEQVALVERLNRLRRFFSPQLAELIVAGGAEDPLRTHRRDVTVCFLDLRGFTAFAESVEPEEVMGVLREYHAEMGRLILAHEGTLERFTGDGIMVFFNDPVPVPDAGERAVRMALAMRDRVAELVRGWRKVGYELDLGIGISQGYATIGAIGFEGRLDYGAIGSVTNLAARLCSEALPGQVLVARRIAALVEGWVDVQPVGELTLKGFARPVAAFQLLEMRRAP